MRADRLLSIMLLLQVNRRMTARELAQRLEVSERTIHRDMEALSGAGIPVVAERGTGGGWSLLETYQTNLTGLNEGEVQALFLSQPSNVLSDLGLHRASEAALIKLLAAIPALSRRDAEYTHQRIYIDATGWNNSKEDVSFLPVLQEAIWQERKVYLTYQRSDGANLERLVDPLGLVAKGSIWYLVAAVEGEVRTYRVSRVRQAELTNLPCVRPPGFDLAKHWEQSSASFITRLPRYPTTVRVTPEILPRMRFAGRFARFEPSEQPPDEEGWLKFSIMFETEAEACEYVLGFGPQIEVLEPAELREKIINLAASVLEFYSQRAASFVRN
jgi:predicted DNA-binding transcriptional regulator YafY